MNGQLKKVRSNSFDLSCLFASKLKPRGQEVGWGWLSLCPWLLVVTHRKWREITDKCFVSLFIFICFKAYAVSIASYVQQMSKKKGVKKTYQKNVTDEPTTKQSLVAALQLIQLLLQLLLLIIIMLNTSDKYTLHPIQKQQNMS